MMSSPDLENLVAAGRLKREPPSAREIVALLESGAARLRDAQREELSLPSRFDLAYNAAHSLSLAALRHHGYRSDFRYLVFQCLGHTLGTPSSLWRVLDKAHGQRNQMEYEGAGEVDPRLLSGLIEAAKSVEASLRQLLASSEGYP